MLVVAALGGTALRRRGESVDAEAEETNAKTAAVALAGVAREHRLVVTHGNGPHVGLLALQSEPHRNERTYPLDLLGADSESKIGSLLERELANELPDRQVASLLTQTVVDALDPAFRAPAAPIGPVYDADEAQRARERGWSVVPDNESWRRVVASPVPRSIVETPTIQLLLDRDVLVVCAGGGGVPIVLDHRGMRYGVEAVVDKDAASAVLARSLGADLLLLLTDVPAVATGWGTPDARPIGEISASKLRALELAPESMAPKAAAAASFVGVTGARAAIGALGDAAALVTGTAGTQVLAAAQN